MGSVHARGDTFLTFGLKALTQTNTSRLATANISMKTMRKVLVVLSVACSWKQKMLILGMPI
jgi:hypothetical protein